MTTLEEKALEARNKMQGSNPAAETAKTAVAARQRIPISTPQLKLQVPDIPGFHLYWFKGVPGRLAQAERAGYVFVTPNEVSLNDVSIGGDAKRSGNTDMGNQVSIVEGSEVDASGNAVRLYLMKQPMEFFLEDRKIMQARNNSIADTLTANYKQGSVGGLAPGEQQVDAASRYVDPRRTRVPELFRRK